MKQSAMHHMAGAFSMVHRAPLHAPYDPIPRNWTGDFSRFRSTMPALAAIRGTLSPPAQ
jgi:hypothetical protein